MVLVVGNEGTGGKIGFVHYEDFNLFLVTSIEFIYILQTLY